MHAYLYVLKQVGKLIRTPVLDNQVGDAGT